MKQYGGVGLKMRGIMAICSVISFSICPMDGCINCCTTWYRMGLQPFAVGVTAFAGNLILVLLLGFLFKQYAKWQAARKQKKV